MVHRRTNLLFQVSVDLITIILQRSRMPSLFLLINVAGSNLDWLYNGMDLSISQRQQCFLWLSKVLYLVRLAEELG